MNKERVLIRSLNSSSGFTLVEALLASTLIGMAMVGATSILMTTVKNQNFQKLQSNVTQLHSELRNHFVDNGSCQQTLQGVTLVNGAEIDITSVLRADGSTKYSLNQPYGDETAVISKMVLKYVPGDLAAPATAGSGEAVIEVSYKSNIDVLGPAQLKPRTFTVRTMKNPTNNVISSCVAASGSGGGSVWEAGTGVSDIFYMGKVGIGTNTPERALHVEGTQLLRDSQDTSYGRLLKFQKIRGAAPASPGDTLGTVEFQGWGSGPAGVGAWFSSISMEAVVSGPVSGSDMPSDLLFQTRNLNQGINEKMRLTHNGKLGIGTTSPRAALDVNGQIRLKSNAIAPTACVTGNGGTIALTSRHTLCICDGASAAWVQSNDGTTACLW